MIRAGIEIYLEFLFSSSFNLFEISFKNIYDTANSIVACVCFVIIVTFTIIVIILIISVKKQISEEEENNSKIKILYENLKKNNSSMMSHIVFITCRILLIAFVLALHK